MDLLTAFNAMLSDVTHVNASARQVTGILVWHGRTRCAVQHAARLTTSRSCLTVSFSVAHTHRTWRASSMLILAALQAQADEAARSRFLALKKAASEDRQAEQDEAAAAAARQRAAAARSRAASASAAAGAARAQAGACDDDGGAAACLAEAAACEAEAAAAAAEAAAADSEAGAHAASAEQHRENARQARALAVLLMAWEIAARDAHGTGTAVLATEEPIARRMYEGIQAAGGLSEVPRDKRYYTRERAGTAGGGTGQ